MLKQGQKIRFNIGTINGTGKIVGKAMNDMAIIGGTYIIEPDDSIRSDEYDYTHFILTENQFTIY